MASAPTEYIYSMHRVSRTHPPNKKVLEDISLSFFPGARIRTSLPLRTPHIDRLFVGFNNMFHDGQSKTRTTRLA